MSTNDYAEHETVVIFTGKDAARLRELRADVQLAAVTSSGPARQGDGSDLAEAAAAHDKFLAAATKRARHIEIKTVGRKVYRDLVEKHPARPDDEEDAERGFNHLTFGDDLVPACIVDGQFPSVADRDSFLDGLSDGQWSVLYSAALELNQSGGPSPKGSLSSRLALISGETGTSPNASD